MRLPVARAAVALSASCLLASGLVASASADGDHQPIPTREQVQRAQGAVTSGARDVAVVRSDLDAARRQADAADLEANKAAEAFNGARYAAGLARDAAALARREEEAATARLDAARDAYRRAAITSYTHHSDLAATAAVVRSDGVAQLVQRLGAAAEGRDSVAERSADLDRAEESARRASDRADATAAEAVAAADDARAARDRAQAAADAAAAQEHATAVREQQLVAELARLQGISSSLAQQREDGLRERREQEAAAAAAAAAAARARHEREVRAQLRSAAAAISRSAPEPTTEPTPEPTPEPTTEPTTEPTAEPTPEPAAAPAVSTGGDAAAAIAFARAQLGEPYVWGASGPDSWDCSGLTMGAWDAGGVSLPHYSAAQYAASTPVDEADLRPGDLVFWADGSPDSIYHVALYVGDGMIIHAPRTGRPVTEDSLYYWIPPSYYAPTLSQATAGGGCRARSDLASVAAWPPTPCRPRPPAATSSRRSTYPRSPGCSTARTSTSAISSAASLPSTRRSWSTQRR